MRNDDQTAVSRLRQVDLNLLVTLGVLLEERSVTRTARRLHLGQPAVSGALARLRELFGDPLLVRVGRTMQPTSRAEALVEPVREILARTEEALWPTEAFDPATLRGEIQVTLGDYEECVLLPALARRLAAESPGVTIRTRSQSAEARAQLDKGEADLWITPFDQRALDLPHETVLVDRWVAVGCARVWPRDARIRHREIGQLELVVRSAPLGAFPQSSTVRRHDLDQPPSISLYASYSASIPFLIAGTERVGVMPGRLARALAGAAGIRVLEWRGLPEIRRVMQWHPRSDRDPFNAWVRSLIAAAGSASDLQQAQVESEA